MQPELVKKRLFGSVISAPLALALLTVLLLWHLRVEHTYSEWFNRTESILNSAQVAKNRVLNLQSALYAWLISGDPSDLAAASQALNQSDAGIKAMVARGSTDAALNKALDDVSRREGRWTHAVQRLLGGKPASAQAAAAQAHPATASLLQSLDDFISAQSSLLSASIRQHQGEQLLVRWLVPLAAAVAALVLIFVSWKNNSAIVREYERVLADAEEANLKTNNFLATVSHELRNPLNLILLWLHLLLSGDRDEEKVVRGLNAIDRAAQAQAQLIEDLLDFAKIESGRLRLDLQATDLPAVVKAGVDAMAAAAEAKSIELRAVIDPRSGMILGDPYRLQQALWNLLSNAVKYTSAGGKIQVQLVRINSHLELGVTDTGQGIAPSFLPHVFDRFWQAEGPAEGQKKGMGLGLTIVKHIVAMHGGSIRVDSPGLGRGATFTVRLPLPMTTEDFQHQRRPHPAIVTTPVARIPRLTGLQIIVVDDDQEATEALRGVLKSLGADPLVADGADRALQLLSEHHPDAMVSDIGMPGRDGLSLAREIRQREQRAGSGHLPLVALTAYGRVEDKVKVFSAGFDSHVVKPVDPAELAAVIRSVIEPNRDSL